MCGNENLNQPAHQEAFYSLLSKRNPVKILIRLRESSLGAHVRRYISLRKHAYPNILKILRPKNEKNQIKKNLICFMFLLKNIDRGYSLEPPRQGGSNEYSQSMFLSRNKKYNVYPCKPQVYYIKVGFKGDKII